MKIETRISRYFAGLFHPRCNVYLMEKNNYNQFAVSPINYFDLAYREIRYGEEDKLSARVHRRIERKQSAETSTLYSTLYSAPHCDNLL